MDDSTSLVAKARMLVAYALLHNIALPDTVLKTLSQADATALDADPAARLEFLAAFADAGKAIGMGVEDLRAIAARNDQLRPQVLAARTLLNFAAANARPVDDDTRNTLVATEAAVEAGTTTLAQEQAFLKAYEELTKALAPITVETLDASTTKLPSLMDLFRRRPEGRAPLPTWTLGRFVNATIFIGVLVGTGISLAYYSVGSTALAKYRELQTSLTTLKQKEAEAQRDLNTKQLALNQFAQKSPDRAASAPATGVSAAKAEEAAAQSALMQSAAELNALQVQRVAVQAELKAIPERLGRWAMQPCLSRNVVFNAALCAGVDAPDATQAGKRISQAAAARAASSAFVTAAIVPTAADEASDAELRGTLVDVEAARTVVSRMSDVYLPLLLGFLGAHAFILRRMSKEISDKTFAKGSAFNHIVRTGLGALAGLASTWLLTPEAVGGASFKALPTWALAFVAGYGIELVFAFMDRVIAAFTSPAK